MILVGAVLIRVWVLFVIIFAIPNLAAAQENNAPQTNEPATLSPQTNEPELKETVDNPAATATSRLQIESRRLHFWRSAPTLEKDHAENKENEKNADVRTFFGASTGHEFAAPLSGNDERDRQAKPEAFDDDGDGESSARPEKQKNFDWQSALVQTGVMLTVQHGFRMIQKKTHRELDGPFFRDWFTSVKNLKGWRDGDNFMTNYIAHPLQGAVTGRIYINNSRTERRLEFSNKKAYWNSRLKAMAWSALWSTQFELGPYSEATIGNVGLRKENGVSPMGWVDLVMTPTAGTGIIIAEDAIDKYVFKRWLERDGRVTTKVKILRSFLMPAMSFGNILRGKVPWKRDNRVVQPDETADDYLLRGRSNID